MSKKMPDMPALDSAEEDLIEQPSTTHRRRIAHVPSTQKSAKKPRSPTPCSQPSTSTSAVVVPSSRKRSRNRITPAAPTKKYSKYEMFGTDSENEEIDGRVPESEEKTSLHHHRTATAEPKAKKPKGSPTHEIPRKSSARDLFGSDSDDDDINPNPGKKAPTIVSHFTKRLPRGGVSRQADPQKKGSHFIELKVYNCEDIKTIQPMNRWRHAIVTIKNKTNDDTEAWAQLTQFIKATRQEFRDCPPEIISGYLQ